MSSTIQQQYRHVDSLRLNLHVAGPEDGAPLFFLHGFPEFGGAWNAQLEYFAARGYRLIAPDQRGYGASDKPPDVAGYHIDKLAGDIIGLADTLGYERIDVVGHDWGGAVLWRLLERYPERLNRAVILNAPQLSVWRSAMQKGASQLFKSWYVLAFQLPWLPEALAGMRDGNMLLKLSGLDRVLSAEERAAYRDAYAGALGSMINWYRAAMRGAAEAGSVPPRPIDTPLLLLWAREDAFLDPSLAEDSLTLCSNARLQYIDDAGHWLEHECPDTVNAAIAGFLGI